MATDHAAHAPTSGTPPLLQTTTTTAQLLPKVIITGGTGNLGTKLSHHLLRHDPPKYRVHLIEHADYFRPELVHPSATVTLGDVADAEATATTDDWASCMDGADALVHFSAVNPYPNANWSESAQSMDHGFNVFHAAVQKKVRRVVFATSNHVMGKYKDYGGTAQLVEGSLRPDLPPDVGTSLIDPVVLAASGNAVAYAAAKLAGERCASSLAAMYAPETTFCCLRIGWCQPGENSPGTLSAAGSPPEFLNANADTCSSDREKDESNATGDDIDENWFKGMWLSNRDFLAYFEAALGVDIPLVWSSDAARTGASSSTTTKSKSKNPHRHQKRGFLLLNAMSHNSGAKWALEETEAHLGVVSEDDSFRPR